MFMDIPAFDQFYEGPLGRAVGIAVKECLSAHWTLFRGKHCLGIGYCFPFLDLFGSNCASVSALTPARLGWRKWDHKSRNCTTFASLQSLPFANAAYDRILIVHALDFTRDREIFLEEIARILAPGGEIALIVPNRVGVWARNDTTPFGQGEPYSRHQLRRLAETAGFFNHHLRSLLYFPPSPRLARKGWCGRLERFGSRLWPGLGGVLLITADREPTEGMKVEKSALKVRPAAAPSAG